MTRMSWIWLFAATLFLPLIAIGDPSKDPTLQVQIKEGAVAVGQDGTDLSEGELRAIQEGFAREIERAPFQRGGSVDFTLSGDRLKDLENRLAGIDIANTAEVDRVIAQTWPQTDESENGPAAGAVSTNTATDNSSRVLVGQNFTVGNGESIDALVAVGGTGDIRGEVGTLVAIGSTIDVASDAKVSKDLVSLGSVIRKHPGSHVTAQEVTVALPAWTSSTVPEESSEEAAPISAGVLAMAAVTSYLFALGLGYLYLRYFPDFHRETENHLRANRGSSFGYGVLAQIAVIPGAALLVISVVGVLLLPFYLSIYGILMFIGYITIARMVGGMVFKNHGRIIAPLALGLFVLELIRLIPVIGWIAVLAISTAGFGAVVVLAWERFKKFRSTPSSLQGPGPGPERGPEAKPGTWEPAPSV